ncbi:N-acetylmuramoyl-L-alanine amidase family protein [Clostridium uliginosum]|uniref:Putative cell wall binding repeat-containing protein n=1 Tax=Clostridium uliginosum TaxID=119641 RepID=A0A1I1PPX2_9CLOT|nr:N-acetylmuramoyl-L-alanine amidase family protein [Clostridium uliginosum]SFD08050.1 Putative cell wall binding repeat-containing protein [Clostridium uliginosum]
MFKRANKITSLLVAAAAVVSLVPATAANAADVKRIESKEGTVYSAKAYKDGSFVIDGDVKEKGTDAVYFLNAGKYTQLENVDSGSTFTGAYGDKYLNVDSGDYFVDLTNGKVTDEKLAENNADDASMALRKKVKDKVDDRYSNDAANVTLTELTGNKFGETWYGTTYTATKATNNVAIGGNLNVYTDAKGNYIDADYNLGKVKVETTTGASVKTTTVDNTKDAYDTAGVTSGTVETKQLSSYVSASTVIGQDSNNIYRTATITLKTTGVATITSVNGLTLDATNCAASGKTFTTTDNKTVSFNVIQKISKAQDSGDVDGAKYSKSVTNYVISDDKGVNSKTLLSGANFSIAGGKVIACDTTVTGKVDVQTIDLKVSKGYTYTDITNVDAEDAKAVEVDVDGNVWRLDGGYIYEFNNDKDWDKVYKVDGSMNEFSVYNKDNMVAWNQKDEVYSVIGNKTEEEKPVVTTKGWVQATDGTWTYVKEDGTKATGWLNLNGTWYYLKDDGVMATGWTNVGGNWYFMQSWGAIKTGWTNVGGTWYFMESWGGMKTGWLNDNGTWYYMQAWGGMAANTTIDGCNLGANGAWIR